MKDTTDADSRHICICGILYFKLNRIDAINEIAKSRIIQRKDIIYIAEREIKGSGQLLLVFLEKLLCEIYLIGMKEQDSEKRSTVCTYRLADCLLKTRPPNITYILSIKNSNILISVSENILVESVFFVQNKICLFLSSHECY